MICQVTDMVGDCTFPAEYESQRFGRVCFAHHTLESREDAERACEAMQMKRKPDENLICLGQTINLNDHAGGNITFQPGKGWKPAEMPNPPVDGDIIFKLPDTTDFMVLKANGDAFVKGEKVESKQAVYDYFAAWLVEANLMPRTGG